MNLYRMYDKIYTVLLKRRSRMERKWTEAQQSAIYADKEKILVSAAAGSGKTATLIERIIRSLTEKDPPMDISRMLIVTFTRAAAAELKTRVMSAITSEVAKNPENMFLQQQLLPLESADICTIDSFCLDIIKNEFYRTNQEADFKIGDDSDLTLIAKKSMDDAVEKVLSEESYNADGRVHEFFAVMKCTGNDKRLTEFLSLIRKDLMNTPDGIEYIRNHIDELNADSRSGDISTRAKKVIIEDTEILLLHIKKLLLEFSKYAEQDDVMMSKYGPAIAYDLNFVNAALGACQREDYFEIRETLASYVPPSLTRISSKLATPHTEAFKEARTEYKKKISDIQKKYYSWNKDDILLINEKSVSFLEILYSVLSSFEEIYAERKRNNHIIEFNDLKRETFKLFVNPDGSPTKLAREYSSKYDIIYIDEYQDVDPIQNKIFAALSSECSQFMVGDIKQSIYGFRGSDSSIFGKMRSSFEPYDPNDKSYHQNSAISMSNNFRCSEPIINTVNHITGHLFRATNYISGGIGYTESDDLVFSKSKPETPSSKVEFVSVERDEDLPPEDDHSTYAPEIRYIARRIQEIMTTETREDGKKFEYGDFAVLCDTNNQVDDVSELLGLLGMPADEPSVRNFFESPEILLLNSLLYSIDNPLRDIPLTAVLLSPLFSFTESELLEIKQTAKKATLFESMEKYASSGTTALAEKCSRIADRFAYYSHLAHSKSVDEFLPIIWSRLDIDAISTFAAEDTKTDEMRLANIKKIYDKAVSYSATGYKTLHDFIAYIDDLIASGKFSENLPFSMDNGNRIHVLTIHKSKGLEFPVVFLFASAAPKKPNTDKPDIVFDPEIGLTFDPSAENGLVKIESPYKKAAESLEKTKQKLERIRLLYVALTRAREKLIITATENANFLRLKEKYADFSPSLFPYIDTETAYSVLKANTYAEWIIQSDMTKCSDIIIRHEKDVIDSSTVEAAAVASNRGFGSDSITDEEIKSMNFNYRSDESEIPAKLTVSSLSPSILDENPVYGMEKINREESFLDAPAFLTEEKLTGAEKGTATHLFLQFCDFGLTERFGVAAEISRLTDKGFILPQHAELINQPSLERFFKSEFYRSLGKAKKVYREQRFNIQLPAHIFTENTEKREAYLDNYVLVQGVIDIIIEKENGEIVLADYKTDYIPNDIFSDDEAIRKMLSERYSSQLSYYALAIRKLFGTYPSSIVIYSLATGKEYKIDFEPSKFD